MEDYKVSGSHSSFKERVHLYFDSVSRTSERVVNQEVILSLQVSNRPVGRRRLVVLILSLTKPDYLSSRVNVDVQRKLRSHVPVTCTCNQIPVTIPPLLDSYFYSTFHTVSESQTSSSLASPST